MSARSTPGGHRPSPLRRSRRAAALSGVIALAFGTVLLVWGVSLESVAMTAGGVLTIVRGVMAILILIGIVLSQRHSREFPDGLYKLENIVVTVIGVVVLVVVYELAGVSVSHLNGEFTFTSDPRYALPFFVVSAILGVGLGWYKRRVAREEGCPSLAADATFSFADAGALVIIGVALTLDIAGFHRVDAVAGLIVASLLAVVGVRILMAGLKVLLDASIDPELRARVRAVAEREDGVRRVLAVDGRNSGSFVFLNLSVEPASGGLDEAGTMAADLERRIRSTVPNVDRIVIEFGSPAGLMTAAVPLEDDRRSVCGSFDAPLIGLIDVVQGKPSGSPVILAGTGKGTADWDATRRGIHLAVFLGRYPARAVALRHPVTDADVARTLDAYGIEALVDPGIRDIHDAAAAVAAFAQRRPGGV